MKKPFHRESSGSNRKDTARRLGKDERWSFNLASESLFALGATERARRVAYRTATGELRFLPT